ncbi:MAG: hypothetical protein COC19_05855 [SAR86 cluster bacterium]|uniref:Uncharacterized protein n=1 Tax=SAR86 cluster bacterium TaxID=2030880 RepID=A0A2A4MKT8_9GAMM|nr:MAG: hypothetical protein COC19_05855 [SAR86 cluster bacterium]
MDTLNSNTEDEIQKKITRLVFVDSVAATMVGFGLYGKFSDKPLPFLNDALVINSLLVIGGVMMVFCGYKVFTLLMMRNK